MVTGALLVDNGNLIVNLDRKQNRERIDFEALAPVLAHRINAEGGETVLWRYKQVYRAYRPGEVTKGYRGFNHHLRELGWSVDERPFKRYEDGRWGEKGVDVALALDAQALVMRGYVSLIAILSNDSDFAALFERLPLDTSRYVVCWKRETPRELHKWAKVIYLEDVWEEIRKGDQNNDHDRNRSL